MSGSMFDLAKAEKIVNAYTKYIIIHDNERYVPATGFEFLLRMYYDQKVYRVKLEERINETELRIRGKKLLRKAKTTQ
jgi:hypothetical protein